MWYRSAVDNNKEGNMLRRLVVLPAFLALSSCGPVYQTTYDFTPPRSFEGRQCINVCQMTQQQCEANETMRHESCEARTEAAYDRCESRKIYRYDHEKGKTKCVENCSCWKESCDEPDLELCQQRYRECYENCGGRVDAYTRCVANCDNAPTSESGRGGKYCPVHVSLRSAPGPIRLLCSSR